MNSEVEQRRVQRKLVAIMAADVVGYSRMVEADERATLKAVRALRTTVLERSIAAYAGSLVKSMGDGFLVEFHSAVDAVACAIAMQQGAAALNGNVPPARQILLRIGINVGDIVSDGSDIYGDGVNLAARLEALCEPGGLCMSAVVREHLHGKLALALIDSGEQTVKNIARPVRVFSVAAPDIRAFALASWQRPRRRRLVRISHPFAPSALGAAMGAVLLAGVAVLFVARPEGGPASAPPRLSIAILPFANLGNDPDQKYFAEGLTDSLTTDLSVMLPDLTVIAHASALAIGDERSDLRRIGRALNVRYLLEGSVQRVADEVRISSRLVDTVDGRQIWADRFAGRRALLASLQDQMSARIANALNVQIVRAGAQAAALDPNPTATDLVMRGEARMAENYSLAVFDAAEQDFRKALVVDPQNEAALIDLGELLALRADVAVGPGADTEGWTSEAQRLFERAMRINSRRAGLHAAMGLNAMALGRFDEAVAQFRTEISIDRNAAASYVNLGNALTRLGRPAEALPMIERGLELNPLDPNISALFMQAIATNFALKRYGPAIAYAERARAANPEVSSTLFWMASCYGMSGNPVAAKKALADALKLQPELTLAAFRDNARHGNTAVKEPTLRFLEGLRRAGLKEK